MANGKRILAFVFGGVFAVGGGGLAVLALWRLLRGRHPALLALAGFGLLFAVLGGGLLYVAVADTDRWAHGSADVETPHVDVGPGYGGGDE